jgi:hypothetical protein
MTFGSWIHKLLANSATRDIRKPPGGVRRPQRPRLALATLEHSMARRS